MIRFDLTFRGRSIDSEKQQFWRRIHSLFLQILKNLQAHPNICSFSMFITFSKSILIHFFLIFFFFSIYQFTLFAGDRRLGTNMMHITIWKNIIRSLVFIPMFHFIPIVLACFIDTKHYALILPILMSGVVKMLACSTK